MSFCIKYGVYITTKQIQGYEKMMVLLSYYHMTEMYDKEINIRNGNKNFTESYKFFEINYIIKKDFYHKKKNITIKKNKKIKICNIVYVEGEHKLIEAIEFQVPQKSSYQKFPNPASRYAIVGVYVAKFKKESNVAVTGVESVVFRCKKIEEALTNNFSESAIDNINISSNGFNSDIHASAEYRAHIIKVMAKKAISACE